MSQYILSSINKGENVWWNAKKYVILHIIFILTLAFHAIVFPQKLQKSNTSFNRVGNTFPDAKFAVQWWTFKQSVPSRRMAKLAVRFKEKKRWRRAKNAPF